MLVGMLVMLVSKDRATGKKLPDYVPPKGAVEKAAKKSAKKKTVKKKTARKKAGSKKVGSKAAPKPPKVDPADIVPFDPAPVSRPRPVVWDPERLNLTKASAMAGCSPSRISNWVSKNGAPKNEDGTYSMPSLFKWALAYSHAGRKGRPMGGSQPEGIEDGTKSELNKLRAERLRLQNMKLSGDAIPREAHEQILVNRAHTLSQYIQRSFTQNIDKFEKKTAGQLRRIMNQFLSGAMQAYIGKGKGSP